MTLLGTLAVTSDFREAISMPSLGESPVPLEASQVDARGHRVAGGLGICVDGSEEVEAGRRATSKHQGPGLHFPGVQVTLPDSLHGQGQKEEVLRDGQIDGRKSGWMGE